LAVLGVRNRKGICGQVEHLNDWTGDQEKRVRDLEIGREGCLQRLKSIEDEQRRTTEAIRDLTKEVRAMNGRRGSR
jgi:hypothetical protein